MGIINLIIILNLVYKINSAECSDFTNCFDCKAQTGDKCEWTNTNCIDNDNPESDIEVLVRLISCYETDNIDNYVSQYCDRTSLILEKKDIDIALVKNGNLYGHSNLLCRYNITNAKEDKTFYIKIKQETTNSKHSILIRKTNGQVENVRDKKLTYIMKKQKNIIIDIYLSVAVEKNPFDITISFSSQDLNTKIIIIVLLIIVAAILIILIVFIILYRKKDTENIIIVEREIQETEKRNKEEQRRAAENKFQEIQGVLFKDLTNNPFTVCSICQEEFLTDEKVLKSPCNHVFHYVCLKNWFLPEESDKVNNNCPECRLNLYDLTGELHKKDKKKNNNNNNNDERLILNLGNENNNNQNNLNANPEQIQNNEAAPPI
jgi:hypothetical protein